MAISHPEYELFLASTSPRRLELLSLAGIRFRTLAPQVDETPRPRESGKKMVARLAHAKAQSVLREIGVPNALVIGADTTVVAPAQRGKPGAVLGKPSNSQEAYAMLKLLQGKTHTVYTGYCLLTHGRKPVVRVVTSLVRMRKLTHEQLIKYSGLAEPMDKAGAYGAQGMGQALIEEIRGSYANVVGLPVAQVIQDLEKLFGVRMFLV